jgi:hypothetical protein
MSPQREVRRYPQILLTEVDESRHYSNGVTNEVYQLQSVVIQKAAEEISHWEIEAALEEGTEDDLLLDVLTRELFPSGGPPLHLRLRPEQSPVHRRLDLGLGHRRPDPRRLWVLDASRLRHHLTARVHGGSNVAKGLDAHALKEHDVEQRC